MDVIISIVTHFLSNLVDVTMQEASYPFRFNKYVRDFETERENLQLKVEGVLDRSKEAKKKTKKVVSDVEKWLYKADSLIAKVTELEEKTKKRNKTSCLKYCPNLIKRYSLSKKLEENINEIKLLCQIEFPEFSRLATLVGMNFFSSQDFLHFGSRNQSYDILLEALKDKQVHMIGLYGMGGCGKTTLAKQVGKEAEQFFDKVVFVSVSQTVDNSKIRGKIASQLDLKFKEEEESDKARRLSMRLISGERFLIILDDVWKKLDFEAIGIVGEKQTGCTILITTRRIEVCRLMNCERMIPLKVLNEDEAWVLFQKHAGEFDDNYDTLKVLAQEITKECGRLPVAIAAVASTLKGKPQVEWDEALKILRDSSLLDIEEGLRNPYTCLRLSYDNLQNDVAKSLFLLCSIFPEDFEIPIDDLTVIGVGLGLIKEVDSYERARNQVITKGINKLMDSCLLLEADGTDGYVKMHDLVRDVALWIGNKEYKFFSGHLKENSIVKDITAVRYLWFDNADKFPSKLNCPKLEFLHLSAESKDGEDVTNDFFKGMEKLKIFIMRNAFDDYKVLQLPTSFHFINLHCLFLDRWSLGDISFIGSLERLESLKLQDCSFVELPKSIAQQKYLRLLDIWDCKIQRNPYEVIGKCSQLEVLYFCGNEVVEWENQGKDGAEFFNKISVTLALESYCIDFGSNGFWFHRSEFPITRSLYVRDHESSMSNATIKDLMQRAEVLVLRGIHRSCKNIIPHVFQTIGGSMHALTQLTLLYSDTVECVIDKMDHLDQIGIISKLTHLILCGMKNLKTLCRGQPSPGLFEKLEFLMIEQCDSIEQIMTDEVKEIVPDDCEYQRSYRFAFPKLKTLFIKRCNQLEYLMSVSFAQSLAQLEYLFIEKADKLKSVFGQSNYEDPDPGKFQLIEFSSLTNLALRELPNIKSICPENYQPTWPSLKNLRVQNIPQLNIKCINHWIVRCGLRQEDDQTASKEVLKAIVIPLESIKEVSVHDNSEIEVLFDVEALPSNGQQVNSTLQELRVSNLPKLRRICRGPEIYLLLQHLVQLHIQRCENLKVIFPASSILRSVPQLRELIIHECNKLEEIIGDADEENQNVSNHQLAFPNLTSISTSKCHKLKRVFPASTCRVLPCLKVINVNYCYELEEIMEENHNVLNLDEAVFPSLTEISIQHCHKLKCVFPVSACRVLPKLRVLWIEEALELEQVFGIGDHEKGKTTITERKHHNNIIPNLEYVILRKLSILTAAGDLQTRRYLIVQQCPQLTLTSTVTPQQLLQILESQEKGLWRLRSRLENIIKSSEACGRETIEQTDSKEREVQSELKSEHITSGAQNNEQNLTENVKESEDQNSQESNTSERKGAKGSIAGSSTENAEIVISSSHSEPPSSLLSFSVTSLPKSFPQDVKGSHDASTSVNPNSVSKALAHIQSQVDQRETDIDIKESKVKSTLESEHTPWHAQNIEQKLSPVASPNLTENVEDLEDQSAQETNLSEERRVTGSVEEGSLSENAAIVSSSIHLEQIGSLLNSLASSLPKAHSQGDQGRVEGSASENIKIVTSSTHLEPANLRRFEDDPGQLPIPSLPMVSTTKNEHVAKALADLEMCLKMPLKDIATLESNSLRLLTVLNFLSRLSFDDGALSHGLKSIIQFLLTDFPSILYSFKAAFAIINKFPILMNEAQEKEARMKEQISRQEKEIKDSEAKISFLQEQQKICVAEIKEFKKVYERVRKEMSEMIEDQRKAQQQLIEADYTWSVLCSQFQHNNVDVHAHQIVRSGLEDNYESKRDYSRETTIQIQRKETEVQAASESEHLSPKIKTNQSYPPIASANLTQYVKQPEDQTVQEETTSKEHDVKKPEHQSGQEETISKEHDVKGSVEGSASENTNIVASSDHSELASSLQSSLVTSPPQAYSHVNQTEVDIEAVAKALVDLEVCLKMPLKDIAIPELNSLRLLTALNFLSRLSFEDGAISPGLKAIIQSLLQHFPSILYSFKSAFTIINKFPRFMNEAQEKGARLKEQISALEKELQDCQAKLSSLQDKKKKCDAETVELNKEFDNVSKERTEKVEDQRKAQQQLFQADYKWSVLCSQFQLNYIAAKNLS